MKTKFRGIKTAAEYRRGEVTRDILRLIAAGVVVGGMAAAAPNTLQLIEYFQPKSKRERNKIWKAIKYLEERQRVHLDDRNGTLYVTLTAKGKLRLDEEAIWEMTIAAPRRWDRRWRLVMFDFPKKHEGVRQLFRNKLEDFGFKMYQRSVFIHPYECHEEVATVARWYGVEEHVRYVVATEINDMRKFVREFDLL